MRSPVNQVAVVRKFKFTWLTLKLQKKSTLYHFKFVSTMEIEDKKQEEPIAYSTSDDAILFKKGNSFQGK